MSAARSVGSRNGRWRRHFALPPAQRVLLFTAALGVLAVVAIAGQVGQRSPGASLGTSWPLVALGFGVCQLFCVYVEFRRDSLMITLTEIPLILGLMTVPPAEMPIAWLVGAGTALVILQLRRRGPSLKLAFNLVSLTFEVAAAAAVYHAILGQRAPLGPVGWLAAVAAAATYNLINSTALPVAVGLLSGKFEPVVWRSLMTAGALSLVANTSLALIAATVLDDNGWAAGLLAIVAGMLYLLARAQARLRQRYASLQVLYDFTSKVGASRAGDAMLTAMLEEARFVLRAESAELLLFGAAGTRPIRTVLAGEDGIVAAHIDDEKEIALEASVLATGLALVIGRKAGSAQQRAEMASRRFKDVMVAPLSIEEGTSGTLLVANRLGESSSFDREDCRVFQALANHAAIALDNSRLIDELRQEALQKEYQALHDPLTGLPNRTLFHREIDTALAAGRESSCEVGVMLMDLDRFKEVNDTLGHHLGDVLLRDIGARLTSALGDSGLVGRLGGDEFGILLRSVGDSTTAGKVAADLCRVLEPPFALGDLLIEVGASIGIAMAPADGDGSTLLLQRADVAMYAAKARGGGTEFYRAEGDRNSPRRLRLLGELRRAIDGGELAVYYQPKADLRTGEILGAEALVRWNHPDHGLLLPAEFIPIAEHSGLMAPLTRHVLDVAMAQCQEWRQQGLSLGIAVNLSVRSLLDVGLPKEIRSVLDFAGLGPECLTLEITEGTLMIDPARAVAVLERLADLGVKLSIDDFGTGYSSLSYLKRLPVSELKIDRCFVGSMTSDPKDAAIVRSTTELGHNLGLDVVAEGVEDWTTWEMLVANSVDVAQGYLLSHPVPAREFETWVRRWHADHLPDSWVGLPGLDTARRGLSVAGTGHHPSRDRPAFSSPSR